MRRPLLFLLLGLAGCTAHIPPPLPSVRDSGIKFALIGDTPYSTFEASALDAVIEDMNREDLAFVIHVGDITSGQGPCSDEWLEARKRQFEKSRHPFILIPGDNEWVDCYRSGFDPIERLKRFRQLFEAGGTSLGERRITAASSLPRGAISPGCSSLPKGTRISRENARDRTDLQNFAPHCAISRSGSASPFSS